MSDDDLDRFTEVASDFLDACNEGEAAKREAMPALLEVLADIYPRYPQKAWHFQGCLFFVQPSEPDSRGGRTWRLGVYSDDPVGKIATDLEPEAGQG